jgi:hypothetical protein
MVAEYDSVHHLVAYLEDLSHTETMIRVFSEVARQFPYSGTASSVGSGRILFATVAILISLLSFFYRPYLGGRRRSPAGEKRCDPRNQNPRIKKAPTGQTACGILAGLLLTCWYII